ncbi:C2H2 finger domain protein [Aspergillus sclerotialis]|uniref:C2H2 finger domain protein n=1 Tax=Aspergillus sclerotialis TaxID=2070753 RepID=A0A3A3AB94_9EURO|nr:C2H2 finger domain protein [Aspergillus sclerotialis]
MSGCMSVPPSADILFASSQSPASASTGPATDSTIRQDLPPEYPLLWSGMSMPLQNRETIPQYHVTEASEGGHFYPSPETCPSPTSDGASLLLSPHPPSSVPSATDTTIDPYPEDSMRANLTSSPLPLNSGLRCLEPSGLNIANMMPATQGGGFVQSDLQCPYPSPEWTATDSLPYGDYSPAMQWKAWSL